jgi:hypothetical protein
MSTVFNRVYRLEIKSVMLVFLTGSVNYCPSNLLSGQLPPPCVNKVHILYKRIQCMGGGGGDMLS